MIVDSPTRLDDALRALERLGDRCQVIAGGTDLIVEMERRMSSPDVSLDAPLGSEDGDGNSQ